MNNTAHPPLTYLIATFLVIGFLWFLWRWLKSSEESSMVLILKWGITAGCIYGIIWGGLKTGPFAVIIAVFLGLVMAIIWTPTLTGMVGNWFGGIYGMGNSKPEYNPAYSIAEARRKRGRYREAIAELENQLLRFPEDFKSMMMIAEIHAEDLKDLQSAEEIVDQICVGEARSVSEICASLNRLADWQLKLGKDPDAAVQALEQIRARYPSSEAAHLAAQRIAHITPKEMLDAKENRRRPEVKETDAHLGTRPKQEPTDDENESKPTGAKELVEHLNQHPEDFEAREKLALIYVREYKRLDMGEDQLRSLIEMPNVPLKKVAFWYNMIADLHIADGGNTEKAKAVLEEFIALHPESAAAENARKRMNLLNLEARSHLERRSIKMGTYEQNIGLKRKT